MSACSIVSLLFNPGLINRGVQFYKRYLHVRCSAKLHMSSGNHLLHSIRCMGMYRAPAKFREGTNLLWESVFLLDWSDRTDSNLLSGATVSTWTMEIYQHAALLL